MYDFVFHNPTKIIFGKDKENLIGKELNKAGIKKLLLVYGKNSVKKSGLLGRVIDSLNEFNIHFVEFSGVKSNPVLTHTRDGIQLAEAEEVDAILAVGGGSVLDESKAIAAGVKSDLDIWEHYKGKPVKTALPVFSILTLAATGSEMNGNAVITNEETKEKLGIGSPAIYPQVSILNPELTCSVPKDYTAYSAVDAIAHVIEAYLTREPSSQIQNRLVESIIQTVIDSTDKIMMNPDDYDARAEFMWAATLALNGLTIAGVGNFSFPNHMIEHSLSAIYDIAHGAGLAIVIPAWMKWYQSKNPVQFERFSEAVFGTSQINEGIENLENWFKKIGAPIRLSDAGIPAEDMEIIVENISAAAKTWGQQEVYTPEVIREIMTLAI